MKCSKAVIVPISPQLKAPSTSCAQHPAETWPSLPERSFTKEGPVSLQTASQPGEKQWFSWVYGTYTQGHMGGNTACSLKRYLSKALWAYLLDDHEIFTLGSCTSISGTLLSQSQAFSFTGSCHCTEWSGGEGLEEISSILKITGCNRNHTSEWHTENLMWVCISQVLHAFIGQMVQLSPLCSAPRNWNLG